MGAVGFFLGLIGALFVAEASGPERLMYAAMPAAMAFVAAMLLSLRDRIRYQAARRRVRRNLLHREDVSDAEFAAHFAGSDSAWLVQTRQAVARFFDVPAEKIYATDDLRKDLKIDTVEPMLHMFITGQLAKARNLPQRPVAFNTARLIDLGDLAAEVRRFISMHIPMPTTVISLMLAVPDTPAAEEWYKKALGAEVLWSLGSVAGLAVDGAAFFLHEPVEGRFESPPALGATTARVEVFVDDPDRVIAQAVEAGAIGNDAKDYELSWGTHRQGGFTDPFGHVWLVGDKTPLNRYGEK